MKFPGLKLHMWSTLMLSKIASLEGRPLFTDMMTAKRSRPTYARVCVEVSVGGHLPEVISI